MASNSWLNPTSGDWNTGTLWSTGAAPNDITADVTIDAINPGSIYTVTIAAGESFKVDKLFLNPTNGGPNNSTGYQGAVLEMDGTLTFANPGSVISIDGALQADIVSNSGTFVNAGTVGGFIVGTGNVLFTGTNGFYVENALQSQGTVTIDTASIAELVGNTLTDGIYDASGVGNVINLGGTLEGLHVDITKLQGPALDPSLGFTPWTELSLDGVDSAINQWNGTAYVGLETTLTDIGARGTVDVLDLRNYLTTNALTIESQGMLNLQAGTVSLGDLNIAAGGILQGAGTITNSIVNNGTIDAFESVMAQDGTTVVNTLNLTGTITGTGVLEFDIDFKNGGTTTNITPATLIVNSVSAGQTVMMNGDDTLVLNTPSAFAGTISAKIGDKIVLNGLTATSAAVNNGTLVVSNAGVTVADLLVSSAVAADGFMVNGSTISVTSAVTPTPTPTPVPTPTPTPVPTPTPTPVPTPTPTPVPTPTPTPVPTPTPTPVPTPTPTPVPTPTPTPVPTPTPTPAQGLTVQDTTSGKAITVTQQAYSGPVAGLTNEYITATSDGVNVTVSTGGWFIHTGSGNDAVAVSQGTNVVDGSTGSNFLTSGSGSDTFFVDDRGPTSDIWSTINKFHAGDSVTVWGVTKDAFKLAWVDGEGAAGYAGLTLHATAAGVPTASMTLVGYTTADLTNNKLTVSYGTTAAEGGVAGSNYMYIHAN